MSIPTHLLTRTGLYGVIIAILLAATPVAGQVVETTPSPPRTDQSVTIFFNAEEGTGGLEGHGGEVYAHTGISTTDNPDQAWKCVKNDWPDDPSFTGNRDDTQLTQVDGDPNRYRLEIGNIRAYYQDTNTSCDLAEDEEIETMNMVFRNADGSKEGKASGGSDIFVDVVDVSGSEPVVTASITNPTGNPPLYPFVASTDTTVTVSVSGDTANVDALSEVRLFVDGTQVASTSDDSLSYDLTMDTPNRFQIRAEVEATNGDSTIIDSTSTFAVRTPNVVDEARPPGVQDGITYNGDGSVTLSLYAPDKEFVYALGDFSNWEIDGDYFMKRHQVAPDSTHWWITLDNLSSGQEYAYQYFVDGELRIGDPFSHKVLSPQDEALDAQALGFSGGIKPYPGDETENLVSVLEPGQEDFNFSDFTPPERSEMVIYELLLRDFVENNSYQTLTDTLDYLDRLGVNAIELMPVSNYGGNESWGYNPNFHLALDKAYGPPEDLKQFVEAAHQRGIAVLLDVVYNHATDQSPLVQMYGTSENPWLNVPASSPFSVFNQLNHGNPFVRHYIDRANTYWLEEFNVDGFRFDLSKGFISGQPNAPNEYQPQRIDNLQRIADHIWDNVDPEAYVILEHFGVPQEEQELSAYRADETGGMMLWNNMNEPYSQVAMGFTEDSDLRNTYYENRNLNNPNYVTYMESHDEQWLMRRNKLFGNSDDGYDVQDLETALNRQKLAGVLFFTVPGPRMMWQFGELGYGWGSDECLKPGGAGNGDCASGAPGRTAPKPIRWDYRDPEQSPDRVRLYKTWSALLQLRSSHEVFTSPDTEVDLDGGGNPQRRIELRHDSMDAVVVGNMGVTRTEVAPKFPSTGAWYDYFTGQRVNIESEEQDAAVSMAPGEFHIYTSAPVDTPEAGLVPYEAVAPPPAAPTSLEASGDPETNTASLSWSASTASDVTGHQVYRGTVATFDTTGQRIATLGPETTSYTDTTITKGTAYYYRVVAQDNDGMRSGATSSARVLLRPSTVAVSASRSFGSGSAKSDYRLVALPGQVSRGLGNTFGGAAGDAWQAYWDDGSPDDYLQKFDGSSTFDLAPGRGFWVISESPWSVDDEFSPVSLAEDAGRQVAIINLRQGWNIISNPLGVDVPWSRVEEANDGSLQPLWRFDGSFGQTDTFASARTGEAFYFHNQGGRARLKIPYVTAAAEAQTASSQGPSLLTLTARGPEGTASTVRVGTSPDAEDAVGPEDVVAPPSQFEPVSLRVRVDDEDASARARMLSRSLRAASNDEGATYELALRAASGTPVRLSVDNVREAGAAVRLINRQTGATHDLRRASSVDLSPPEEETRWALLVGSESFVEKEQSELQPESLTLWPTYPNPFREQTTIEYTLPEAGDVRLEVYDLLGRRVQVLADGRHEEGLHRVVWNGRHGGGAPAASGLYIVRLQANGTTRSRKMTLVR